MNLADATPIPVGVDTHYELLALVILTVSGWIGLFIKSWLDSRQVKRTSDSVAKMRAAVSEVQGQVVNGHKGAPPLRADIDQLRAWIKDIRTSQIGHGKDTALLREDISLLRADFGNLHREVQRMARDQADFERRVAEFAAREHPAAQPL